MKRKSMANTGGYTPESSHKEGAGHSKQPDGKSIGYGSKRNWKSGNVFAGNGKQSNSADMAKVGRKDRGSSLVSKSNDAHAKQPGGHSTGEPEGRAPHLREYKLGEAYSFRHHPASNAHGFRHEGGLRQGALRMSGVKGAHRLGCKK